MIFSLWLEEDTEYGSGIFFTDGKKFLALQYPDGSWTTPGGHIKKGENELESAKRESKEECGHCNGINFGTIVEPDNKWTSFLFKIKKPFKCVLSNEHVDCKWVSLDKANALHYNKNFKKYLNQHIEMTLDHNK